MKLVALNLVAVAGLVLAACGPTAEGMGSVEIANRHSFCPLLVSLDGAEEISLAAGQSRRFDELSAEGHELRFETVDCIIYVTHGGSPFPSGRSTCNVIVSAETTLSVRARDISTSTPSEMGVYCP